MPVNVQSTVFECSFAYCGIEGIIFEHIVGKLGDLTDVLLSLGRVLIGTAQPILRNGRDMVDFFIEFEQRLKGGLVVSSDDDALGQQVDEVQLGKVEPQYHLEYGAENLKRILLPIDKHFEDVTDEFLVRV